MVLPTTEIIESFLYYTLIREQHHTLTTPQKLDIESLTFVVFFIFYLLANSNYNNAFKIRSKIAKKLSLFIEINLLSHYMI